MRKALWLLPLVALIPITSSAEGTDEGAMWTEIGIQKSINKQWKVGLGGISAVKEIVARTHLEILDGLI